MQTFTTLAHKSDVAVAKDVVDELIHRRFLEPTSSIRPAAESGRTLDFLG